MQAAEPVDQRTRDALQKSVQLAIEITTNSQEAAARHEAQRLEQEAKGRLERQKIQDEAQVCVYVCVYICMCVCVCACLYVVLWLSLN